MLTNQQKETSVFSPFTSKLKKRQLRIVALFCLAFLIFSSISVTSTGACRLPVAYFSYSPLEPMVNQMVTFNASASYDPDGGIVSYKWDFGDGTTGSGIIVNHTYTAVGSYIVTLTIKDNHCLKADYTVIVAVSKPTLNVQTYVGSMHFAGEIAEFYVLVSQSGKSVNATMTALLYYGGVLYDNLSASVEYVAQGLYRIPYEIPLEASEGSYVLVVEATYGGVQEIALEGFLVSSTLTGWNATLVDIQENIAIIKTDVSTIKISLEDINATLVRIEGDVAIIKTEIGEIKVNLDEINATLISIDGRIVTIETNLGIIKTTVENINLTVTNIDGNNVDISTTLGEIKGIIESIRDDIALIKTKLGDIEARLPSTQATPLSVSLGAIFAAIAAIASIIVVVLLLIKRKKPTIF